MGKPDAPDYKAAAEATAASDKEMLDLQTKANRPNRNNPWGNESWEQDADGNWTQNTSLNADLQGALDSQIAMQRGRSDQANSMMGRFRNEFGDTMDWEQFGEHTDLEFDPTEMRQRAEDASYNRATSRLDPRFEQDKTDLDISLRNRGLSEGDAAYDSAMDTFQRGRTDAYSDAQNRSVGQGRAESAQLFGQQTSKADYANKLRQDKMTEEMQRRGFSLNEINAIMTGQQVNAPQFNSFNQAGRGAATDYSGAANNQSNFDQGTYGAFMGGMGDIIGAGASMYGMGG